MTCTSQVDIKTVQALLVALQDDNQEQATVLLDEITQLRESELHQLIDNRFLLQTKHDIPEVTERLEYVLSSTEEACDKTLVSTEKAMVLSESISELIQDALLSDTQQAQIQCLLSELNTELTNILLSQSFQDLTGQVLNRVVLTISSLEQSLIQLISESGHDYAAIPDREEDNTIQKSAEMKGIGPNVTQKSKQDSVGSQDDVDDLLGELGI